MFFKKSADRHLGIGLAKAERGKLDSALKHFRRAETIARVSHNNEEIGKALNNQGRMLLEKGNLEAALTRFQEAETCFKAADSTQELAKAYNNQGGIFFAQGDYKRALEFFKKKEDLSRSIMDSVGVGRSLINQGAALLHLDRSDEAVECFATSFETCTAHGDAQGAGEAAFNIGVAYVKHVPTPDIAIPIKFFAMSVRCFQNANDRKGCDKCRNAIAEIRQENPQEFERAFKRVSEEFGEIFDA